MSQKDTCLIELFTEELPPKALLNLSLHFVESLKAQLNEQQFTFEHIIPFATPRRLAALIHELSDEQPTQKIQRKGPPLQHAYTETGEPTTACIQFAKTCGVEISQLSTLKTEKGEWLYCEFEKPGTNLAHALPNMMTQALKQLPIPKFMRWGNHDYQFARPVHNLMVLYGKNVLPCQLFGCDSNRTLYGHRFMAPKPIALKHAKHYETELRDKGFVVASFEKRKALIIDQINALVAKQFDETAIPMLDQNLLNEVTAIVEWPEALIVPFDPQFLSIPKEALLSAMQVHQKCFGIIDHDKQLLPFFITISNLTSKSPKAVIQGNARVMQARLADAMFFYNTDCSHSLESLTPKLQHITYEKTLGSLQEKVERIKNLAAYLTPPLSEPNSKAVTLAAQLCKSDLVSTMVEEFPELQGIMGYYYALHDDLPEAVALAIKEHYLPRQAKDRLPQSIPGMILALADRLDSLAGIFTINKAPSGEKDPFALRRAAFGVIRICIENKIHLDLPPLITQAQNAFHHIDAQHDAIQIQLLQFFYERLRGYIKERGISTDAYKAVIATKPNDLLTAFQKMQAIHAFTNTEAATSLIQANKRVNNLLKQYATDVSISDINKLQAPAEIALVKATKALEEPFHTLIKQEEYTEALRLLASLNDPINTFFDTVMVMSDDPKATNNRMALLQNIQGLFLTIADITLLQ